MLETRDYHILKCLDKSERRALIVRLVFGSQAAVGRELGLHRVTIHQVVRLKQRSRRVEGFIRERVRKYGREFEQLWTA